MLDKVVSLEVPGWVKLEIEYSLELQAGVSYLCWRVKGTDQIFRILATMVYEKHGLAFSDHFSLTLKKFREDYMEWEEKDFPEEWMKRYQKMFYNKILT